MRLSTREEQGRRVSIPVLTPSLRPSVSQDHQLERSVLATDGYRQEPSTHRARSVATLLHEMVELVTPTLGDAGVVLRCYASEVLVNRTTHLLALLVSIIDDQALTFDIRRLRIQADAQIDRSGQALRFHIELLGSWREGFNSPSSDWTSSGDELATILGAQCQASRTGDCCVHIIHVPIELEGSDPPLRRRDP